MSAHTLKLTPALVNYIHQYGVQETPLLAALRAETQSTFEAAPMQISPEQGQFFRFLLELMGAKRVLEIGTFTGYSAACMALALPNDGHVTCCDSSTDWTRLAREYWEKMGLSNKITLHIAPALKTLQKLIDNNQAGTFDFAFIDADKINYLRYYEYCLDLVQTNGVIAIDNVLWDGEVVNPDNLNDNTETIRMLNDIVRHDDRVSICMLPIGDGLTLARKLS